MSFYATQTKVVDLGDGNSITIRKLSYGESSTVNSKAYSTGVYDPFRFSMERMLLCVTAWDGSGFDGRSVTPENIKALPVEIAGKINNAIAEFHSVVTIEEGNASGAATN